MIREARREDLQGLLQLYTHLHDNPLPPDTDALHTLWDSILSDENQHIIVAEEDGRIVSSCVCVIVSNLTHGQRPYALLENVVTDAAHHGRGLATACLGEACGLARRRNAYKCMLMTGSKQESTLRFYERAGFSRQEKTAFVRWL